MVSPFSSVSTLAKVAQYAQWLFFASVMSAMQIPERQHSELTESVRLFERGEEALTECGGLGGCAWIILGKIIATLIGNGVIPCEPNNQEFEVFRRASHSVYVSRPQDVAAVIQEAASNAR